MYAKNSMTRLNAKIIYRFLIDFVKIINKLKFN